MMLETSGRQSYGLLAALLAGWLILLGLLLMYPGFLAAHTAPVRTMPADGAVVAQPPREVRFWFNEPIERYFSRIEVFRAVLDPGTGAVQPGERIDQGWLPGPRAAREVGVRLPQRHSHQAATLDIIRNSDIIEHISRRKNYAIKNSAPQTKLRPR